LRKFLVKRGLDTAAIFSYQPRMKLSTALLGTVNVWFKRIADAAQHRMTGDPVPAKAGPPVAA
jgi:hypothetical protein